MEGAAASLSYEIGHAGDTTAFPTVSATWLKDGISIGKVTVNTPENSGCHNSSLYFSFVESDAGVYQCAIIDTARSEVFVTVPLRLDTGKNYKTKEFLPPFWEEILPYVLITKKELPALT